MVFNSACTWRMVTPSLMRTIEKNPEALRDSRTLTPSRDTWLAIGMKTPGCAIFSVP